MLLLFCYSVSYSWIPTTPPWGALFPSLCRKFFEASGCSLFLSYLFTYFMIRSLPVGSRAFSLGDFLVTFALPSITLCLWDDFQSFQNQLLPFVFLLVIWLSIHLIVVDACGLCWLAEGKSQDMLMQLILFAYGLMHVYSDMQALPERRDCAVCGQLLPGSRFNLDRPQVRDRCSLLSISSAYPILAHCASSWDRPMFPSKEKQHGRFLCHWLASLCSHSSFSVSVSHAAFWSLVFFLFFLICLYRQYLIASI